LGSPVVAVVVVVAAVVVVGFAIDDQTLAGQAEHFARIGSHVAVVAVGSVGLVVAVEAFGVLDSAGEHDAPAQRP